MPGVGRLGSTEDIRISIIGASAPRTEVVFFQDVRRRAPVRDWLQDLFQANPRAFAKCVARLRRLANLGHELRRPEADFLGHGVHELRIRFGRVNYRILYCFYASIQAVLVHALTKEATISAADLQRAISRFRSFKRDPGAHTYVEDLTR